MAGYQDIKATPILPQDQIEKAMRLAGNWWDRGRSVVEKMTESRGKKKADDLVRELTTGR